MTPIRWPSSKASSWSCVTRIVVTPSVFWISLRFWRSCDPDLHVERAEGLVEQENGRPVGEGPRQRDALSLAAGELALVPAPEAARGRRARAAPRAAARAPRPAPSGSAGRTRCSRRRSCAGRSNSSGRRSRRRAPAGARCVTSRPASRIDALVRREAGRRSSAGWCSCRCPRRRAARRARRLSTSSETRSTVTCSRVALGDVLESDRHRASRSACPCNAAGRRR